jgi:hypothetical protein
MTNHFAGDPGLWPLRFCQPDGTGIARFHHARCVTDRLNTDQRAPWDPVKLGYELNEALGLYSECLSIATDAGYDGYEVQARSELLQILWDNKIGVIAHLLNGVAQGSEVTPAMINAGAQALANDVWHPPQQLMSLALYEQDKFRRQARIVLEAASPLSHQSAPDFLPSHTSGERLPSSDAAGSGAGTCRYCNGTKRALYFSEQGWAQEWRDCHICAMTSTTRGGEA